VVEAATRFFVADGCTRATTVDIAREAGVAMPAGCSAGRRMANLMPSRPIAVA
jgi:hypothetical protein